MQVATPQQMVHPDRSCNLRTLFLTLEIITEISTERNEKKKTATYSRSRVIRNRRAAVRWQSQLFFLLFFFHKILLFCLCVWRCVCVWTDLSPDTLTTKRRWEKNTRKKNLRKLFTWLDVCAVCGVCDSVRPHNITILCRYFANIFL